MIIIKFEQFERRFDKKNRLMTLFLSDGSTSVKAVEKEFIDVLSEDILPGRKVFESFRNINLMLLSNF